jgi:hypothetical protein
MSLQERLGRIPRTDWFADSGCYRHIIDAAVIRPKGPAVNRPDRQVGIRLMFTLSAEGAALNRKRIVCQNQFHDAGAVPEALAENRFSCGVHADCGYIQSRPVPENGSR